MEASIEEARASADGSATVRSCSRRVERGRVSSSESIASAPFEGVVVSFVVDWSGLEDAWVRAATAAIVETARAHPAEVIRAGAFWLFCSDYSQILAPAFALDTQSHLASRDAAGDWYLRWWPADWHWPVVDDAVEAVLPRYAPLSDLASIGASAFDELDDAHYTSIARASLRLTAAARGCLDGFERVKLPSDFFVAILAINHSGYEELLRASVEDTILGEHPELLAGSDD